MARIRKTQSLSVEDRPSYDGEKVWRLAVYIRLSREDGNDESESVINQKKIILDYLEKRFDSQYTVVDFYIDDGLTGTDDTREHFVRMIQDIEMGSVDCVIVKTLSRAFRNYSDQGYYLEYYFLQKNVRFVSIGDPSIDTFKNPDAITSLEVPITGIMNDRFAAKTSNDIRRTFHYKRHKGEFIGSFAPYGYKKDPANKNHLIIDEEPARIKRDMRNWIVHESMSLMGVAKRLNELGIPNPTAYKRQLGMAYSNPNAEKNDGLWSARTVKETLISKMNLGHMVQGRQKVVSYKVHDVISIPEEDWITVENTHEPIFKQEEYDALISVLRRDTRTPNSSKTVHLFGGFLRCADCKKAMHRRQSKGYVYYACRTYGEKSKEKCTRHGIRDDVLQKAVLSTIQAQIAMAQNMSVVVELVNRQAVVHTQTNRFMSLMEARKKELMKIHKAYDSLYIDWKSGEVSDENYRRMKERFSAQMDLISQNIAFLEQEQRLTNSGVTNENPLYTAFLQHRNIEKLDRGVLIALVDTIFVYEDRRIEIVFNHGDQHMRVEEYIEANTKDDAVGKKGTDILLS